LVASLVSVALTFVTVAAIVLVKVGVSVLVAVSVNGIGVKVGAVVAVAGKMIVTAAFLGASLVQVGLGTAAGDPQATRNNPIRTI